MLDQFKPGRVGAAILAIACTCALIGTQVPPAAASPPDIGTQLAAVASSPAGANAELQLAKFATSPDVAAAAQFLLSTQRPNLTGFQKSLLSLAPLITANAQVIQDRAAGKRLSPAEEFAAVALRARFDANPAIQVLEQTGARFKYSAGLSSTLSSDAAALSTPVTVIPAGSGVLQVDSFDSALGNFATAADLPTLAPAMASILQARNFPNFLTQFGPLVAASLIPGDQTWKLLLPHDHDPSVVDYVDFIGGVLTLLIGATAAIMATVPALVTAAIVLTIVGTLIGVGTLTFHFLSTIDCDHDGDPWDASDVAGSEC